jgi:hypothetical protein
VPARCCAVAVPTAARFLPQGKFLTDPRSEKKHGQIRRMQTNSSYKSVGDSAETGGSDKTNGASQSAITAETGASLQKRVGRPNGVLLQKRVGRP